MSAVVAPNRSEAMSGYQLDLSEVRSPARYTTLEFLLSKPNSLGGRILPLLLRHVVCRAMYLSVCQPATWIGSVALSQDRPSRTSTTQPMDGDL